MKRLDDIIKIKHGYAFKGVYFVDGPTKHVLVTPGNFHIGGGFKTDKYKFYNGPVPEGYVLNEGDVIVTMTDLSKKADTLGYSAKVPKSNELKFLHNQRIGLIKVINKEFDINYIYWLLRTEEYQKFIAGAASGSTVKHTSPSKIGMYKFKAPDNIQTQKKIASILSAYDDLIENNLKRIKLLEEIALRTYEEWFVKFRINGEQLPVDDKTGLPLGWERRKLVEIAAITMGQSPKSEFYNKEQNGLPFHQGVSDYGFRYPINSTWSSEGSRFAKKGEILFSVRAPVGRLNMAIEKIILGRGLCSIRHNKGYTDSLFYQLQNIFFKDDLIGGGAIFASVTKSDVEKISIIEPDLIMLKKYNEFASQVNKQIENLTLQNFHLKASRDILLPRLMNSTVKVSES